MDRLSRTPLPAASKVHFPYRYIAWWVCIWYSVQCIYVHKSPTSGVGGGGWIKQCRKWHSVNKQYAQSVIEAVTTLCISLSLRIELMYMCRDFQWVPKGKPAITHNTGVLPSPCIWNPSSCVEETALKQMSPGSVLKNNNKIVSPPKVIPYGHTQLYMIVSKSVDAIR